MLVPTVLGPEEREDHELEVVRVPFKQVSDTVELPIRQAKGAMERMFRRDLRQSSESIQVGRRPSGTFGDE